MSVSCADAIDRLLHFAIAAVAPLHRVGGGTEQAVIKEGQRLFQIDGEHAIQDLPHLREALDALAQACQLGEGRRGATAAIKELIDFVHDVA